MALAILPNWLGDLVMVEPALRALRERGPVTGVVSPGLAGLVEDAAVVDEVERFDRRGRDRGVTGLLRAGARLRGHEVAWVFGPSLRAAALAAATGARRRIGFGGHGRELFLTEARRGAGRRMHLVDQWTGLVGEGDTACRWSPGPRGKRGLADLQADEAALRSDFAVFAASANYGPTKEWPGSSYVEVARGLREREGLVPVFVGSPAQRELELAQSLASSCGGVSLAGRTDLCTLVGVLGAARVFVGNDSGPMHLAAAVGTPTVGIFGSTAPGWTAPRGRRTRVAGPPPGVDCTPCFRKSCPYDRECLTGISAAEVLADARALLAGGA